MASDNPEIHTEEIALFSRPPVNVAEDRVSWHEIRPSYMSNAEYSSINFSILGNSTQYQILNCMFELQFKKKMQHPIS